MNVKLKLMLSSFGTYIFSDLLPGHLDDEHQSSVLAESIFEHRASRKTPVAEPLAWDVLGSRDAGRMKRRDDFKQEQKRVARRLHSSPHEELEEVVLSVVFLSDQPLEESPQ